MDWRLGIDLGAKSLGWCAVLLVGGAPSRVLWAGSRIFSDGRTPNGTSLAVDRREAKAMRRRRDRFKRRQAALLKYLIADGLFPGDPEELKALESLDPYALRARALDQVLPLPHLGRALFHINQRRGFKSNRKTERKADDSVGKIDIGIDRLREAMHTCAARTFGEFLFLRRRSARNMNEIPPVRTRLRPEAGEGAKGDGYDFYPGRSLLEEEFAAIWEAQAGFRPDALTPEIRDRLYEIIFHQRPLKAPRIGTCTLIPGEERLPKAHPLFQQRRLLEELNALMIIRPGEKAQRLTREQRDLLWLKLKDKKKVSFKTLREKVLKLGEDVVFNKESEHRHELAGDELAAVMGDKARFGARWAHFPADEQWGIIAQLIDAEDEEPLRAWLGACYGLSAEQAKSVAGAPLPSGYGRFGLTATTRLIEVLRGEVIVYNEAVIRAGLGHHSDFRTGEVYDELPYYGIALERHIMPGTAAPGDCEEMRIGRLTNPTVHIGLNQLRLVVNALIRRYGRPAEIAIELARDLKLTDEQKKRLGAINKKNRDAGAAYSKKLIELGQADNGRNRLILRLWQELNPENVLDRRCIYTGQQISCAMLFNGSVEIDHILPFDETLDDSGANKILCLREANRAKHKRSPFEAWGHTDDWNEIAARAARLAPEKRWRFEPDAMHRFQAEGGFLARHLADTQYLSRLAREYLSVLYPDRGEGSAHVRASPGRLTELVRRKLGLNDLLPDHNFGGGADQPKNRLDHRHHAIDAAVVAILDRSLLNQMARASAQEGAEGRERIIIPEPWSGFREELRTVLGQITVSHRPDHGKTALGKSGTASHQTAARLHNDTAYGLTGKVDGKGSPWVVHRVPLDRLTSAQLGDIRDESLREALLAFTAGLKDQEFAKALSNFPRLGPLQFRGIRRVRVWEPLNVILIRDRDGHAYKGYKGDSNYRFDVWELADGRWKAEIVSMFDAHQPGWVSSLRAEYPTARKVLSLQQNDTIALEPAGGVRRLMRVVKFAQNGQITLAEPQEAGDLKRRDATANQEDPFKYVSPNAGGLKRDKARQVRVDALGRVFDPGFPARTARRPTRSKPV